MSQNDRYGVVTGIVSVHELTSSRLNLCLNVIAQARSTFLNRPSMTSVVYLDLWSFSNLGDEGMKGIAKRSNYNTFTYLNVVVCLKMKCKCQYMDLW